MGGRAVGGLGIALRDVQLRLVRDVADRARLGATPEQRALRTLQHLDAFHVGHVYVDIARRERHRLIVEVSRDVRERIDRGARLVAGKAGGEAAHVDIALAGAVGAEGYVRQVLEDVVEGRHVQLRELFTGDRLYRDRDVLNRLVAPLRGDDDFLDATGSFGIGRRGRMGSARVSAEHGRNGIGKLMIGVQASLPKESVAKEIRKCNERHRYARGSERQIHPS